jgi:ubiquinone/menaquinone biosynthesis C-methylase UbiE
MQHYSHYGQPAQDWTYSAPYGTRVPAQLHTEKILRHYNSPAVAAGYGRQEYITPCERLLFSTYIKPGMAVLDIGVGGGRTSGYLARNASRYVGIDYASEMVRICREKYPQWEYFESSATDLSLFLSASFDVVVMSYNMLDDLVPDESRWRCLQECHRVLRENGLLIFSSHNPRAILVRPQRKRIGPQRPSHMASHSVRPSALMRKALHQSAIVFTCLCASVRKAFDYGTKYPFWRGEGYAPDYDNLMTHFWVPAKAIAELLRYGFRFITLQGDDYPLKSHQLITDWYYYVFQK